MGDLSLVDLSGGRNGIDSPVAVPHNQCCEAINIDFYETACGGKRGGAGSVSTGGGTQFTGSLRAMHRHVPNDDETLAEFWAVDETGIVKRLIPSSAFWQNITLTDAISGNYTEIVFCTFNGKLFMAYRSAQDRLHVWDPTNNKVRRVGLPAMNAPAVADTGAGTYPAVERYYRTRAIDYVGGVVRRRSEPSLSTHFVPSGGGTAARITLSGAPGEDETHWEVEGSVDNETFYVLAGVAMGNPIVIGTTTYDDSATPANYADNELSEEVGLFNLPKSAKFLTTDNNRLLMGSSWVDPALSSHIYFTPVLGSADHGDDERFESTDTTKGYVALNRRDGGGLTGLSISAVEGVVYGFKYRQIHKLTPTGLATAPYRPAKISNSIGAIHVKTIVEARDAQGLSMCAFLSHVGPYRIDTEGVRAMGRDIDDVWFGLNGRESTLGMNLSANIVPGHGVYYSDKCQIHWWIALFGAQSPNVRIVVDIRRNTMMDHRYGLRGGWTIFTGKSCRAVCSTMFGSTTGPSVSLKLVPYIGYKNA